MSKEIMKGGANVLLVGHKCFRCGHEWLPRNEKEIPIVCPKCKSPYWAKPKGKNSLSTRR